MDKNTKEPKMGLEDFVIQDRSLKPIVYAGLQNQKSVLYFNDYFEKKPIYELINNIESVRQVGSYSVIDLYFTSNGGYIDSLFVLSDYLNNIDDIEINFIVTGMVASCGFYILVLINNQHINISFNGFCKGLIHLADVALSDRAQRTHEDKRYDYDKFSKIEIDKLNDWFRTSILPYLGLSSTDLKKLDEGKDILLSSDELEDVVYNYKEYVMATSPEFLSNYMQVVNGITELREKKRDMERIYKKYNGTNLRERLGLSEKKEKIKIQTTETTNEN